LQPKAKSSRAVAKSQAEIANSCKYLRTDANELEHTNGDRAEGQDFWALPELCRIIFPKDLLDSRLCRWLSLKSFSRLHLSS